MIATADVVFPIACALLHASYGVAEVALARASRSALETRSGEGDRGAHAALAVRADEDVLLASALVGTSLFGAVGVAVSARLAWETGLPVAGSLAYVAALAAVDALLPRVIGPEAALTFAGPSARLLFATRIALFPLVTAVSAWARVIGAAAGSTRRSGLTRQEILLSVDEGGDAGLDPHEQTLIRRVFALRDTRVRACMTPIAEVDTVPPEITVREAAAAVTRSGHTRLLVREPTTGTFVGVVHARDLLFPRDDAAPVRTAMRPLRKVSAARPIHEVFPELRRQRVALALVVDEDVRPIGILTLEDLVEELVGEIHDERDRTAPPPPTR